MTTSVRAAIFVVLSFLGAACSKAPQDNEVNVAAAANLTQVAPELQSKFQQQTGIRAVFSFASTGQLTEQIENGGPFDVFLAADAAHVAELQKRGLLASGGRSIYAIGVLALWIPPSGPADVARIEDLTRPEVRFIAIAKPELAPYGHAAVETLQKSGLWDKVQNKIVYAENINMARQFGASGNADAVFTAMSLVSQEAGRAIPVNENLDQPIAQELGVIKTSPHPQAARKFADFILRGSGRDVLKKAGYGLP